MRVDVYLVEKQVCKSRMQAQDAIQEGRVRVNGKVITKNSFLIQEGMHVDMQDAQHVFASRAGYKLYDVLADFRVQLQDRICIDVGASTGGFSDVCLQAGANLVYAVDVGKGQLLSHLENDPRIVNMEGCNCRYLRASMFAMQPDFACIDVSFISLKLILPVLIREFQDIEIIALIKPQFEAGKAHIGKQGVVKNKSVHIQVLQDMISFVERIGYVVHHIQASSIIGRSGNKEFVMHIKKTAIQRVFPLKQIVQNNNIKR